MHTTHLHIAGQVLESSSRETFERRNPIDGKVVTRAAAASTQDALRAANAARDAFTTWSRTTPAERRALLQETARRLQQHASAFIQLLADECGCSRLWASFNVSAAVEMLQEAAALTTQVSGEVIPSNVPGNLALGVRQPAGVVLGMAPWNAAVVLAARAIAVPLACGNTVILKGSETCPATHELVARAFIEAGFPPGVVNFIVHAPQDAAQVVESMVAHPAVRRVNFTGSTKVGRSIAEVCARWLKPAVLELGGKAPLLVLADADLDAAVNAAAFGGYLNSGQICMSTERIIVDSSVVEEFANGLAAKLSQLSPADPRDEQAILGSVVDAKTVERCNALIDDALSKGATLVCGGRADSVLMRPTLLDRVTSEMRIYHEESFGPVKGIVRVSGDDEAVACANDNLFGLSAAIFSRDAARALELASRIQSGICHINAPTVHDEPQMPFGGVKDSGIGRFGSRAGIAEFTDLRWISLQTSPRAYPF